MQKTLPDKIRINFMDGSAVMARLREDSRARRLIMRLEPDGRVVISVPAGTRFPEIGDFAQAAAPRLQKALSKLAPEKAAFPEFVDAPLLGRRFHVHRCLSGEGTQPARGGCQFFLQGNEIAARTGSEDGPAMLALQDFFLKLASEPLTAYIMKEAPADAIFRVTVRNQRKRMGSCARKIIAGKPGLPAISLNWRAMLLPLPLLRHLCMHEIAHIWHMNHSEKFHACLETLSPAARQREKELNAAWKGLPPWVFYRE